MGLKIAAALFDLFLLGVGIMAPYLLGENPSHALLGTIWIVLFVLGAAAAYFAFWPAKKPKKNVNPKIDQSIRAANNSGTIKQTNNNKGH